MNDVILEPYNSPQILLESSENPQIDFIFDLRGESLYQTWLQIGNIGDRQAFINWLRIKGDDGLTAYEVAVLNGFVGTELEWLNSLNGVIASINSYQNKLIPDDADNAIIEEVNGTKKRLSILNLYNFIKLRIESIIATSISSKEDVGVAEQLDETVLSNANDYADSLVIGLWDDRGSFNAAVNTFPVSGGSGAMGTILKGDIWTISEEATGGPLFGYLLGTTVRAKIDTPGQLTENWALLEVGFGYVPENKYNKVESLSVGSTHQQYPTAKLVYDQLANKQPTGDYLVPSDITELVDNNTAIAYSIALS